LEVNLDNLFERFQEASPPMIKCGICGQDLSGFTPEQPVLCSFCTGWDGVPDVPLLISRKLPAEVEPSAASLKSAEPLRCCPVCDEALPNFAAREPAYCAFCPWGVSLVSPPFVKSPFRKNNV
jgi:hypothetical protein